MVQKPDQAQPLGRTESRNWTVHPIRDHPSRVVIPIFPSFGLVRANPFGSTKPDQTGAISTTHGRQLTHVQLTNSLNTSWVSGNISRSGNCVCRVRANLEGKSRSFIKCTSINPRWYTALLYLNSLYFSSRLPSLTYPSKCLPGQPRLLRRDSCRSSEGVEFIHHFGPEDQSQDLCNHVL